MGVNYSGIYPRGATSDIKAGLKARLLTGWSGDSLNSDMGCLRGITTTATVQSSIKKLGTKALSFNNQNSPLTLRMNETLALADRFSICFWQYYNSFSYGLAFASWNSVSVAQGQLLFINNTGGNPAQIDFAVAYGSSYYTVSAALGLVAIGAWSYVICEIDKVNLKIRLFINNALIGETTIPSGFKLNAGTDAFSLGGYHVGFGSFTQMDGYLDEFVILLGNTSSDERGWLYNIASGNSLV